MSVDVPEGKVYWWPCPECGEICFHRVAGTHILVICRSCGHQSGECDLTLDEINHPEFVRYYFERSGDPYDLLEES